MFYIQGLWNPKRKKSYFLLTTSEACYQVEILFIITFHKITKSLDSLMFSNFWDIKKASGLSDPTIKVNQTVMGNKQNKHKIILLNSSLALTKKQHM